MTGKITKFLFVLSVMILIAPINSSAQTSRTVLQQQFGKQTITVGSNETITFYDPWDANGYFEFGRHNSHSLTVFRPTEENMAIVIKFEYVDIHSKLDKDNEDSSIEIYEGELNVYDGDPDADNTWDWSTAIWEVHYDKSLPTAGLIAHLDGTYNNLSYSSTVADGSLSVGLFWRTANNSDGWKATVTCVPRNNMKTISAGAYYDKVAQNPQYKNNVSLGSFFINTDGVLNADHLRSVSFQFTRNDGVFNPALLRIYRGEGTYLANQEAIEAYYSASSGTYTLSLDEPLTTGKNTFTIAGDILTSAPFGGKASMAITQITTDLKPTGVRPFDKGTPVTITNPPTLLMSTGNKAVTIGDTNIDFYDDGGVQNDVTPGFEGSITFIPENPDKKIRVDFKSVSLSSGSIYYQQINIYNGKIKDKEHLIGSLKHSEKGIFNSTSDDGCLTVEFLSNGTNQTSSGFHAVVSQESPTAMELKRIDVMQASEDWVNAGDTNQPIMKFNLYTENTEPVLEISSFTFNTGNTHSIISKASVFYTGTSSDFDTHQKVGEVAVNGNEFTINLPSPLELKEHNNYFVLAYDITDEAERDQTIDANFLSMTVGGKSVAVENGSSKGNRTVENIILSHRNQGTVTTIVAVEYDFQSKDEFSNMHSYEAGDDNRTNIFIPKHTGSVCQIDFSEFLIQYVEGYVGAHKSKFEIYSGQGNDRQLLWKLASVDQRDKGPGEPLRSTAEDGSLTVIFNPNDVLGNYVAPGFKATVSEYKPKIMSLSDVVVTQTSTDVVNNGTSNQDLLTMNVKTTGNLSTINMQGVELNLKNSQTNINKLNVYYTGKNDLQPSNGTLVGTATTIKSNSITINFSTNINLVEGDNYFRIVADIAENAPTGAVIDAAVQAIKLDGTLNVVTNGDPQGERIVKNTTPKDMQVNSLNAVTFADGNARKGETDVIMLRIDLEVEGENKLLSAEEFAFELSGASVEKVRIYQTGLEESFSPANSIGEQVVSGSNSSTIQCNVKGRYPLTQEGTYHFWAVCDVKQSAKVGDKFSLSLMNVTLSGQKYNCNNNNKTTMTIVAGKQGTITVGTEGDYATIQAAVDAISDGIDGAVTIEIQPGIYNERVNVPNIKGASERNPIIIKGVTGNPQHVRIYHNYWEELPYTEDRMAREFGLFTFDGASFVTLEGVEITTTALNYPSLIHLKNAARHITIDNCYLHTASTINNLEGGVNLIYGYAQNEANQNNDYLKVTNSVFEGGYIGVNMGGTSYVDLPKEVGGVVEGNVFREQGFKAIYVMDELGAKIRNNKIYNSTSYKGNYSAIDTQIRNDYEEQMVIEGNVINLSCPETAYGMYLREISGSAENPVLIINNEIVFSNNNNDAYPVYMTRKSKNLNFAHNTIITHTAAGAIIWIANEMDNDVNIVNNIFQSLSAHEVINLGTSKNATTINFANNIYYTNGYQFAKASGSNVVYTNFSDWLGKVNDHNSIAKQVTFLSNDILAPSTTLDGDLLKAQKLSYVEKDINGQVRAVNPTIGAYEYDETTAAPQMNATYPAAENITDTSVTITVSPDKNALAYAIVRLEVESQPTISEVLASNHSVSVRQDDTESITFDNLQTGETYIGYVVLHGLRGQNSQLYTTAPFKAEGYKMIELPTPILTITGNNEIEQQGTAILTAIIESGTAPFSVTWLNGKHEVIHEESLSENGSSELSYQPSECDDYFVTVVDRYGKMAADTFRIIVKGEAVCASFENLYVDEIGYYNGRDLRGSFVSGSYLFESKNMPQHSYWYGFAYSNSTASTFESLYPDQFNNAVGGGRNGSENYAVAFPEDCAIKVLNKPSDRLKGFYITNNAFTMDAILHGDGMTDGVFGYGDYLRLTIIGTHADGTTAMKHVYLADFQSTNTDDYYALDTWQWVDLRPLGEVEKLTFKMMSSRNDEHGMTTPAYFCIDDFNGERDIFDGGTLYNDVALNLASVFDFDNSNATVTYWLDEDTSDEMRSAVELTSDGLLKSCQTGIEGEIIVCALKCGKQQFARINLSTLTGIEEIYDGEAGNISGAWTAIYDSEGRIVKANDEANKNLNQELRQMKSGVYLVKMNNGQTKKICIASNR